MFYFLLVLIGLIGVLMAIAILLQSGKGGGLAGVAAGGQTTQILGARQAPDFLEKATWGLGGSFLVLCLLASFFTDSAGDRQSILQQNAAGGTEAPAPAPQTAPPGAAPLTPSPGVPGSAQPGAPTPLPGSPAPNTGSVPAPVAPAPTPAPVE